MIAIIDYGVGNLFSLKSSFASIGIDAIVATTKEEVEKCDKIILPGVGAFGDAIAKLRASGLAEVVTGLIDGEIRPISDVIDPELKIPHIGWNALSFTEPKSEIFKYLQEGDFVYFVHSYYGANCQGSTIATAEYSVPLTAAVAKGNIYGCQFHPEKSGDTGLKILKAFCEIEVKN